MARDGVRKNASRDEQIRGIVGKSYGQIAKEFNISRQRVHQIIKYNGLDSNKRKN
jgi:Mor family transcriptional regulator